MVRLINYIELVINGVSQVVQAVNSKGSTIE
jgi:hypothetical protein